jgi:hypothetical protein
MGDEHLRVEATAGTTEQATSAADALMGHDIETGSPSAAQAVSAPMEEVEILVAAVSWGDTIQTAQSIGPPPASLVARNHVVAGAAGVREDISVLREAGGIIHEAIEVSPCQTRGHGIPDVARISTRYGMGHIPYPYVM